MNDLQKLKLDRDRSANAMRAMLDICERESRDFTEAEKSRYEELDEELTMVLTRIENQERLNRALNNRSDSNSRYDQIFRDHPAVENPGFEHLGELIYLAGNGRLDDRFNSLAAEVRAATTKESSWAGYLAPTEFEREVFDSFIQQTTIFDRCRIIPMTAREIELPCWDSEDRESDIYGWSPTWSGEGSARSYQDAKVRLVSLHLHTLDLYSSASNELLRASNFETIIQPAMSKAIAFTLEEALVAGNGVAKPKGIKNANCAIKVGRATAGAISYEDLRGMVAKVIPGDDSGYIWLASPTAYENLLNITDPGSAGTLLFAPDKGPIGGMMGYPLFKSEFAATLGSEGDLMLVNPKYYVCGIQTNPGLIAFEASPHALFSQNKVAYRCEILGVDGDMIVDSKITLRSGDECSPVVILK
ncbi:MAG: phage major capsid protein [Deltaproteobacteria bacterium]|nr:phage major capsid protein [Deltaproteobacteria bacterium]